MKTRIGIFLTHPVQYHTCLWRGLANQKNLDVEVFYFSDQGLSAAVDPGFGTSVKWDVPLLEGYSSSFLRKVPIGEVEQATIPRLDDFLVEKQFEVVLLHGYTHAFARQLVRARRRFGYRVVLHGEFTDMPREGASWWKSSLKAVYLKWFYGKVDRFCPIGVDAVAHLERRRISKERMTVTPYSVDDQFIDQQRGKYDRNGARESLGLGEGQVLFLFSGKLIPRKQPLLLAEAVSRLADRSRVAVAYLGSGEQQNAVEEKLRPLLGKRLIMPGFVNQSELGRYFAAADVFVLPTSYDTWGLVVNEAMHWGLPCIVSDRTGCRRDLVVGGETGFIHPWNDASALADRMQCFLDDPMLASRLGKAAAQRIEDFRSAVVVDRLQKAFERRVE